MKNFEVQFDLKGSLIVSADNYDKAEIFAKQKLKQYQDSMKLHFQKDIELNIDDVEKIA